MFATNQTVALALLLVISIGAGTDAATARVRKDGTRWILANPSVERVIETKPFLRTVSITNRLADKPRQHVTQSRGFLLALDNDTLSLDAAAFQSEAPVVTESDDGAHITFPLSCEEHGVRVTVTYQLGHTAFYLRKQLEVDPGEHLLNSVDVESFRLDEADLHRFDQEPMPFRMVPWDIRVGRPLLVGDGLFLGVEHPASINSFDSQGWISLRQHPGRKEKVTTSPAVIGVCPDRPRERLLDYFERYVAENRAQPVKRCIQWIAYFHAGMDDDFCREKIAVAENVFRRRGVPIDVVLMDSGWTDPQSIMSISRKRPQRLALVSDLVRERLGAKLGLHVITSGVKPMVDKDWLAAEGYDMIYHKSQRAGAYCFADPRVFAEFRDNLVRYVRQYNIASYKFDWGHFECGVAGHRGHLPGKQFGFEAGATSFRRVHQALREANPDIFLYNTGWYSPWWLWTYDAVFSAGADYNFGLDGPPSFSTASLLCTWRDATIRGNLVRWSPFFPLNSLMTVDPISYWWHDWDARSESLLHPFTDYFLMAGLRGTQMTEIYNNIAAWSDAHADAAASILKWMKANDEVILASTRYIGGDPLHGEAYGYAHFTPENRGIIAVRNPTIQPRTIAIPFDESAGMWPGEKEYVIRTVYPYTMALPVTVRYGSKCEQRLDSHEVRVLEVWPLEALPEPMPIGCRYQATQRDAGKTTFRIRACPDTLHLFSPVAISGGTPLAGQPRRYAVPVVASHAGDVPTEEDTLGRLSESPYVQNGRYVVPVDARQGGSLRVAFLFGEPGLEGELTLDGQPAEADAPHIRLSDADGREAALQQVYSGNKGGRGMRAKASNWSLFGAEVGPGEHEVRFQPAVRPKQGALVITDFRLSMPPENTLTISHEPLTRQTKTPPPQNWAWERRQVDTFSLPPVDSEADTESEAN